MTRLLIHPLLIAFLAWPLGWGLFDGLFGEKGPAKVDASAVRTELESAVRLGEHDRTASIYRAGEYAPLWDADERRAIAAALSDAEAEGIAPEAIGADAVTDAIQVWDGARREWAAMDGDAREAARDPRPALLARADVRLTDALLRFGDALGGFRADPTQLHPGTWFPARPDSLAPDRIASAVASGDAEKALDAIDDLRPEHPEYDALREAMSRLIEASPAPVPDGAPLAVGGRSIRVPHVRARLAALGYLGHDAPDTGWNDTEPYLFDGPLAAALARFRDARGLSPDSLLDATATAALNADLDSLADRVAINLERWRWLPEDFGDRHVWVNLPAYHLEVREPGGEVGLEMTVNIGNAKTTGWTTPVISDSITSVIFRPAWYVPRSLVYSQVLPMARADSLSLWRQGFEVTRNGASVDSRLVKWDSVDTSGFRFMQRPGAANPLGRAKFPMTNPYAILIHDTNRSDFGGPVSSGCVHAGDAEALAAYLLRAEGWDESRAQEAYRRGPQRQGVRLDDPVKTHFVYLTAEVDDSGALVFHDDPYGYDRKQARALAL